VFQPEALEFRNQRERRRNGGDRLSDLLYVSLGHVGVAADGEPQVFELLGIDSHDAAAGGIDGDGIAAGDDYPGLLRGTLDWPVSLHPDDAVNNRELPWESGMQIGDGLGNAGPVEYVLGPSVDAA